METRRTRGKRIKYDVEFKCDSGEISDQNDPESLEDIRKSKIRDSNKEYAKRMTILQAWSDHWSDYTTREGDAYPKKEALAILKKSKKILCPIESCKKAFTTFGGLRYHYARCNIERCFKCKVCNPPTDSKTKGDLLRHMVRSHYDQLPGLDDEQKEIANTYLNTTANLKKRTSITDRETHVNCYGTVRSYFDMIEKAFTKSSNEQPSFRDWLTPSGDWELVTYETDRHRYYPPEIESPRFKVSSSEWKSLRAGESIITDNSSLDVIFYTGGISTAGAWIPKPFFDSTATDAMPDLLATAICCCPMDKTLYYKDVKDLRGCIQFWTTQVSSIESTCKITTKPELAFIVGHQWGNIFEMSWCPLGTSWQNPVYLSDIKDNTPMSRAGLLALACGDGQIRIISVPHLQNLDAAASSNAKFGTNIHTAGRDVLSYTRIYRVKPVACLAPPGSGQSTDFETPACTSICWNLEDNQRLLVAGYSNGNIALFDIANYSPILYNSVEHYHIYRPFKTWFAHGLPVTGVALLSDHLERTLVATGSRDRQLKLWNSMDLNTCLASDRCPITRVLWDYRFRGIVTSTEASFTSYTNRVSYRYPALDGSHTTVTVATHRATVWGLASSIITSSLATSDEAGELIIAVYGRPIHKRDRNPLNAHSILTVLPHPVDNPSSHCHSVTVANSASHIQQQQQTNSSSSVYPGLQTVNDRETLANKLVQQNDGGNLVVSVNENSFVITEPVTGIDLDENNEDNNHEDVYGLAERSLANKPSRFLLPMGHRAVETYADFKQNFGLDYVVYEQLQPERDQKLPESCARAGDIAKIYCDRVCDYRFSSIIHVSFSPNANSFPYLMSISHIGLCRLDKIKVVEQAYRDHVVTLSCAALSKRQQQQQR